MPTTQICPPAVARLTTLLDSWQFEKHRISVVTHAERDGEGVMTTPTAVSYEDWSQMHKMDRKTRKRSSPPWAFDNNALQKLILTLWLKRVYSSRVERAKFLADHKDMKPFKQLELLQSLLLRLVENRFYPRLDSLCYEFVQCSDPARRKGLIAQIQNLDGRIRSDLAGPARAMQLLHLSYGLCWDSVSIASELHLTSVCVRQILSRARRTWCEISGEPFSPQNWGGHRPARTKQHQEHAQAMVKLGQPVGDGRETE